MSKLFFHIIGISPTLVDTTGRPHAADSKATLPKLSYSVIDINDVH